MRHLMRCSDCTFTQVELTGSQGDETLGQSCIHSTSHQMKCMAIGRTCTTQLGARWQLGVEIDPLSYQNRTSILN